MHVAVGSELTWCQRKSGSENLLAYHLRPYALTTNLLTNVLTQSPATEEDAAAPPELACLLSFVRVKAYLEQVGTRLGPSDAPLLQDFEALQRRCLLGMAAVLKSAAAPASRQAHHYRGGSGIVRHPKGQFLNLHHKALASGSSCVDLRELAEAPTGVGAGAGAGAGAGSPREHSPREPGSPRKGLHRRTNSSATVDQPETWSSTPTYMLEVRHGDAKPPLPWRLARRTVRCLVRCVSKVCNVGSSPRGFRAVSTGR